MTVNTKDFLNYPGVPSRRPWAEQTKMPADRQADIFIFAVSKSSKRVPLPLRT